VEIYEDFWNTEIGALVESALLLEISDCGETLWDSGVDIGCPGWDPVEYSTEEEILYSPLFARVLEEYWGA